MENNVKDLEEDHFFKVSVFLWAVLRAANELFVADTPTIADALSALHFWRRALNASNLLKLPFQCAFGPIRCTGCVPSLMKTMFTVAWKRDAFSRNLCWLFLDTWGYLTLSTLFTVI